MLKFYILKRDEWEDKDSHAIIQFETVADLEAYLSYNRAYIKEMKTLDEDTTYSFGHSTLETVADDVPNRFANIV
jgi:hypothetical protein